MIMAQEIPSQVSHAKVVENASPDSLSSPQSQENFFRKSTATAALLSKFVDLGVLPPKEIGQWRPCAGQDIPTPDTHERVVLASFFARGLGLPICRFVKGLLRFYSIDLIHLNSNSILQLAIFIHLCEAFLGIPPHFGLWKYLFHCKVEKFRGVQQMIGGASLEMRKDRRSVYLNSNLKDTNKGWHAEWFVMVNHHDSIPSPSGQKPDLETKAWEEAPTEEEMVEVNALLKEIQALKDKGLTAHAVVIDFVFHNIQPLKERMYPAYYYTGLKDPTRETDRDFSEDEVRARVQSILKGAVYNEGSPRAYSAWFPRVKVLSLWTFFTYFPSYEGCRS